MIIYTNETCPYCKLVKEEFDKNNLDYKERLTSEHETEWREVIFLTGTPAVPTIVYKNNYFVPGRDFQSATHLVDIVNYFQESPHEISVRILELLKTLTFNIYSAFGKTDTLLRQIEEKLNKKEEEKEK